MTASSGLPPTPFELHLKLAAAMAAGWWELAQVFSHDSFAFRRGFQGWLPMSATPAPVLHTSTAAADPVGCRHENGRGPGQA